MVTWCYDDHPKLTMRQTTEAVLDYKRDAGVKMTEKIQKINAFVGARTYFCLRIERL